MHIVLYFCFACLRLVYVASFSGLSIFGSVFSNVYLSLLYNHKTLQKENVVQELYQ